MVLSAGSPSRAPVWGGREAELPGATPALLISFSQGDLDAGSRTGSREGVLLADGGDLPNPPLGDSGSGEDCSQVVDCEPTHSRIAALGKFHPVVWAGSGSPHRGQLQEGTRPLLSTWADPSKPLGGSSRGGTTRKALGRRALSIQATHCTPGVQASDTGDWPRGQRCCVGRQRCPGRALRRQLRVFHGTVPLRMLLPLAAPQPSPGSSGRHARSSAFGSFFSSAVEKLRTKPSCSWVWAFCSSTAAQKERG